MLSTLPCPQGTVDPHGSRDFGEALLVACTFEFWESYRYSGSRTHMVQEVFQCIGPEAMAKLALRRL